MKRKSQSNKFGTNTQNLQKPQTNKFGTNTPINRDQNSKIYKKSQSKKTETKIPKSTKNPNQIKRDQNSKIYKNPNQIKRE